MKRRRRRGSKPGTVRETPAPYDPGAAPNRAAYFDASALVKRYVASAMGAAAVAALWPTCERYSASFAPVEVRAGLARRRREGTLDATSESTLAEAARQDQSEMELVPPETPVIEEALRLVATHPLRTLDALHLASAIVVVRRGPEDFVFVTGDHRLAAAARAEGLRVLVPA